ncbi:MAG TPA: nuclear transport factor 2 family protein [Pyrinomonadaceae bacterium]|nr:nuclear transport factor 2 family protein [Pyrinomonadaceae bacterium]
MRKIRAETFIFIFLAVAAMLALNTISLAQSSKQKKAIESEIKRVLTQQVDAWNSGSVKGFMEGYRRSPDTILISNNITRGWQNILERYEKSYPTRERMGKLQFSELEFYILSLNSAVVSGRWSVELANSVPSGRFTLIFRRFPEGWRIVYDHTS